VCPCAPCDTQKREFLNFFEFDEPILEKIINFGVELISEIAKTMF
jgi:hypothetical protein